MRELNFATKVIVEGVQVSKDKITPEQHRNRNSVQEELNSLQIKTFSFESYEKSEDESNLLKRMKKSTPKVGKYRTFQLEEFKNVWKNSQTN